jgi:hypothetical protein
METEEENIIEAMKQRKIVYSMLWRLIATVPRPSKLQSYKFHHSCAMENSRSKNYKACKKF